MANSNVPSLFDVVPDPLARLRERVALLAAHAEDQVAWLVEEGLDSDELAVMILDVVPGWLPVLRDAGLITTSTEQAIRHLGVAVDALLEGTDDVLFTDEAVTTASEWQQLRQLARVALEEMDRAR